MNLASISMSGFKSFADPTEIDLRAGISVIVGPNGCGKSNILDAVRWVLGESSAQRLRGEVNSDFIFQGTDSRVASNRARVEMVFENPDGEAGGEFSAYSEISVARELSLDAQSNYYLNGRSCRRRDIQNVFYGTGFGTSGYSIIQQDWITQLLHSDPVSLRSHLEEAADVSKYRAQRHESINKLNLTEQHLEQLRFQRETCQKEIRQLKRHATQAVQYQNLENKLRELNAEFTSNQLEQKTAEESQLKVDLTDLEGRLARLNQAEEEISGNLQALEVSRTTHQTERDRLASQGFQTSASIKSAEERIESINDKLRDTGDIIVNRLRQVKTSLVELNQDSNLIERTHQELLSIQAREIELRQELTRLEPRVVSTEREKTEVQDQVRKLAKELDLVRTQSKDLLTKQEYESQHESRLRDLLASSTPGGFGTESIVAQIEKETDQRNKVARERDDMDSQITALEGRIKVAVDDQSTAERQLKESHPSLQKLNDQLTGLKALREANSASDSESSARQIWLMRWGLEESGQLRHILNVERGWERAFELVLGDLLQAIQSSNLGEDLTHLAELVDSDLSLFELGKEEQEQVSDSSGLIPLASKLNDKQHQIFPILNGVYIADSIEDAIEMRPKLKYGESLITKDGMWLTSNWVRVNRGRINTPGVLELERQIEVLTKDQLELEKERKKWTGELDSAQGKLANLRNQHSSLQRTYFTLSTDLARHETLLNQLKVQLAEQERSNKKATREIENQRDKLEETRGFLQGVDQQKEVLQARTDLLETEWISADEKRRQVEVTYEECSEIFSQGNEELKRIDLQKQQLERTRNAQSSAVERQYQFVRYTTQELRQLIDQDRKDKRLLPRLQEQYSDDVKAYQKIEEELKTAESSLQLLQQELNELRSRQNELVSTKNEIHDQRANQVGIVNGLAVEINQLKSKLSDLNIPANAIVTSDRDEETIQREIDYTRERISRLGAINYRAGEELETKTSELEELEVNITDVELAATHLRDAIGQVDQDTKSSLKRTFDAVNLNFNRTFRTLFGGGRASIELTEDDILQAGVIVKAQPPGKRNSTINMLSGGERAMTAIAFVFALFELNPSPVCILDEVDAPLDEKNVNQFSDMLVGMTGSTQFVVITHNPATMERADTLLGVTMEEAGVSRLVSVNLEDAYTLAAS